MTGVQTCALPILLISFFGQVVKPKKVVKEKKETVSSVAETLNLTLEELNLPTRIVNALRKGGYETLSDLKAATSEDLGKVKNLGEKSIKTVQKILEKK